MTATMLALAGAVTLAASYVMLTDHLDDASLRRRQIDIWAFLAGWGCLVVMLFGGADAHRAHRVRLAAEARVAVVAGPTVVARQQRGALALAGQVPTGLFEAARSAVRQDQAATAAADLPVAAPPAAPVADAPGRAYTRLGADLTPVAPETPVVLVEALPWTRGVFTPALAVPSPISSATPVVSNEVVILPPPTAPRPRLPTVVPPTLPPPTAPPPWPTPTPHCGDPHDIALALDVVEAVIDRSGDAPVVRYRAQARNASLFPVTLVDILVTLESRGGSPEQFGHARLADVAIESGVLHVFEGSVPVTKGPSPFDRTQVCISTVPETCGRSIPYQNLKRCIPARGF